MSAFFVFAVSSVCSALRAEGADPFVEIMPTRPNMDQGPTRVEVGIYLIDIDSINSAEQNFVANVFISLKWNDPRLGHAGKKIKRYPLLEVWSPQIQIANEIGLVRKTLPDLVEVDSAGNVSYRQRYVGSFSQRLNLEDFPFDKQTFRLHLVSVGSAPGEIEFVANENFLESGLAHAAGISGDISLPDWKIFEYETKPMPYQLSPTAAAEGYAFEFTAARGIRHYMWKVILPLIFIVLMSMTVFWLDPSIHAATQIGVSTTSMLTLIAYRFAVDSYIPRVAYHTRLDQFILISTILVFCSLLQVIVTANYISMKKERIANLMDSVSRVIFPVLFIVGIVKSLVIR